MRKAGIAAAFILPLFAAGIAAGGRGEAGAARELNIVFSGAPQPYEKEYVTGVFVKNFERGRGVKVNVDFTSQAGCIRKIESEQSADNAVSDVLYVDTANMAPYVNGGWMRDLGGMIHPGVSYTGIFDGITGRDGVRYFIPNSFDVYLLAAFVDALAYLPPGLTREDVENGISWEEYAEWARAIARGEGTGKTMIPASTRDSQLLYPLAGMTLAYGGLFPDFGSAGFKKALSLIAYMAEGGAFYPEQGLYNAPADPMKSRDVWLSFGHMGPIGAAYNAAPGEWVIGAAPRGTKGAGSTSGAWCWGIQKGAPNGDIARAWIDYVSTPRVNYEICSALSLLSPINEVAPLLGAGDVIMAAGSRMLAGTIISGVPSTEYRDWDAVKMLYHEAFDRTLAAKEVPPAAFLEDLDAVLRALRN